MAKIKDLSDNKIIEVKDKERIEKLLGYPDKFELVEEEKPKKTETKEKEIKSFDKSKKEIETKEK